MDINTLITCKRLIVKNGDDFIKWKNGEDVGRMERAKGYGYFQLFNINYQSNRKFFYSEEYTDASESDLEFRDRFKIKSELDTYVVHLGETNQNWSGRISKIFSNDTNSVFSLLKNISFYNRNEMKYNNDIKDDNQFIIHVTSLYKDDDYGYNKRSILAQSSWKELYENQKIIPLTINESVYNKNIPKIKDLFDAGYNMCLNDNDVIMYTNSDICLTEDSYQKVIDSCNKYNCTFSFRKDFIVLNSPMNKNMVENANYSNGNIKPKGADLFAVTKSWWKKWRDYLPNDQVIGRPTWDWVFRITMGKSIEGDIVFTQPFEEQGSVCETPNISYHEIHDSYWEKPENIFEENSIKNTKIAYNWMKEKSSIDSFTGKDWMEKTYGEYIKENY